MFGNKRPTRSEDVRQQIESLERERDSLNDSLLKVRNELSDLKAQRKREDEDIRHLVKIKESKLDIDFQKKDLAREKEKQDAIAKVKDEYRDKMETELQKQLERMQGMYGEILGRLPNVNVRLKGDV